MMLGKSGAVAFQPLSALRQLRRLEAGSCCLAALPPPLSCCAALEALELHANPSLGTASLQPLALLSSITHLDLSSCGLAELPAPLSGLTTLRALCLADNALGAGEQGEAAGGGSRAFVPGGGSSSSGGGSGGGGFGALSRLTALTSLSLAGCCLPALPGGLARLSSLQSLDLGDNEMLGAGSEGGGWGALWGLSALTRLEVSCCKHESIKLLKPPSQLAGGLGWRLHVGCLELRAKCHNNSACVPLYSTGLSLRRLLPAIPPHLPCTPLHARVRTHARTRARTHTHIHPTCSTHHLDPSPASPATAD